MPPRDNHGRHRAGFWLLAASGVYLVAWALALPDWWRPSQNVLGTDVPTVALGFPWALLMFAGVFLAYQDHSTSE